MVALVADGALGCMDGDYLKVLRPIFARDAVGTSGAIQIVFRPCLVGWEVFGGFWGGSHCRGNASVLLDVAHVCGCGKVFSEAERC